MGGVGGGGRIKKKNEKMRCNLNYTVPTSVKSGPYSVSAEAGVRYKKWSPKFLSHSSGAVCESRWTSWAVRPDEPSGFRGRKDLLNRASALVSACP